MKFVDFLKVWDLEENEFDTVRIYRENGDLNNLIIECQISVLEMAHNGCFSLNLEAVKEDEPEFDVKVEKIKSLFDCDLSRFFFVQMDYDEVGMIIILK